MLETLYTALRSIPMDMFLHEVDAFGLVPSDSEIVCLHFAICAARPGEEWRTW